MEISIDMGFGYVKAVAGNRQVIVPSVAGEAPQLAYAQFGEERSEIETQDGFFLIGDSARLHSMQARNNLDKGWVLTDEYYALCMFAITELTRSSRVEISLTTGLPYSDYMANDKSLSRQLAAALQGEQIVKRRGKTQHLFINQSRERKLLVVPQNYGGAFFHLFDSNGNLALPNKGQASIGCLNIGANTIELGQFIVDLSTRRFNWIGKQSSSFRGGILSVLPGLRDLLANQFQGETWEDYELFDILQTGQTKLYSHNYPLNGIVNEVLAPFHQKIYSLCADNWSEVKGRLTKLSRLDMLTVSGGGAHIVAPFLQQQPGYKELVVVSADPQWDTVRGYERFRKAYDRSL